MDSTSLSFLDRLQSGKLEQKDHDRIRDLYCPLIRHWIFRISGLTSNNADVDDLAQDVLAVLIREVPTFERRRTGAFRSWVREITRLRIWNFWRAKKKQPAVGGDSVAKALDQLQDPGSDLSRAWDKEHKEHITSKMLAMVQPDFDAKTWKAFMRVALQGLPAQQVAEDLGMTVGAVIQAKSRILKRLRDIRHFFLE